MDLSRMSITASISDSYILLIIVYNYNGYKQ